MKNELYKKYVINNHVYVGIIKNHYQGYCCYLKIPIDYLDNNSETLVIDWKLFFEKNKNINKTYLGALKIPLTRSERLTRLNILENSIDNLIKSDSQELSESEICVVNAKTDKVLIINSTSIIDIKDNLYVKVDEIMSELLQIRYKTRLNELL